MYKHFYGQFKRLVLLLTITVLASYPALGAPIYTQDDTKILSDSVTLTRTNAFYADHDITYTVIKADLTSNHTSLTLLTPRGGADTFDTVSALAATDPETIAALNADFFSIQKGNRGFSTGIEIKDGKLITSPINPDTMATVYSDESGVDMSYLDFHIMAVAPNGQYHEVRHLNKHTTWYGDILMYTSDFNGGYSLAPGGEVVEVVVEAGKIKEFRRGLGPVAIPGDGCVLVVSEGINMFLANNFAVGDEIRFDYYMTPDISKVNTAFGAGAMLVSEGKALTSFSHVVSGYQPRSAIGTDQSGNVVYLVTVDGRQSASRGMTMAELAELMVSLGCYKAVNLDGGGSSNMVASTMEEPSMHTVNSPTENRKVVNAAGIRHTQSIGDTSGIVVTPDKDTLFIGDSVTLTVSPHDSYLRPTGADCTLHSDQGNVSGNTFTPSVGGKVQIHAVSGSARGSAEVFVIDKVDSIGLRDYISLSPGESASLEVNVSDNYGHFANVTNPSHLHISSSDSSVVSVSGQTVTGHKSGKAVITVKKDGAISYASVTVGDGGYRYTDTFESESGGFTSYPSYVKGSFELSIDTAYADGHSGKLTYDFTEENDETKAAYFKLDAPKTLSSLADEISIFAYVPSIFNHELRAQLTDKNGNAVRLVLGKGITPGKWQQLTAHIPDDAARPLKLDRIYAVYVSGEERDAGCIYIDNLSFIASKALKFGSAPSNVYTSPIASSGNAKMSIGILSSDTPTLFTAFVDSAVRNAVSSAPSHILLGDSKGFGTREDDHALYITLDTSKGGIRATDSTQWNNLANALYATNKRNVFILSHDPIYGNSSNENRVINEYLSSIDKEITVICGGDRNTYKNINGVKYFTLLNSEKTDISSQRLANSLYLEFTFGESVSFEWKNTALSSPKNN